MPHKQVHRNIDSGNLTFRLEEGGTLTLTPGDAQLRDLVRAWCSTVHAFQGRTIATCARLGGRPAAELVTDEAGALKEQLEAVTGKRISALERIGEAV